MPWTNQGESISEADGYAWYKRDQTEAGNIMQKNWLDM